MIPALALAAAAVGVQWDAPPPCPTAAQVQALVEDRLGSRTGAGTLRATVERGPSQWRAEVIITVPAGRAERAVLGRTCTEVAEATAALAATMLDPSLAASEGGPIDAAPRPPAPPARRHRVRGLVSIAGTGTFAALPRFGGGLLASAGVDTHYVRAEAVATYEAPQLRLLDAEAGAGAVFDLWTIGARGCGVGRVQTLVIPVCAGLEVGRLRARGEGLQAGRRVRLTHARAAVGAGLGWAATRWLEVRADVAGLVTLTPWRVVIDDLGELHRSRPVGVRVGLGFAALFP